MDMEKTDHVNPMSVWTAFWVHQADWGHAEEPASLLKSGYFWTLFLVFFSETLIISLFSVRRSVFMALSLTQHFEFPWLWWLDKFSSHTLNPIISCCEKFNRGLVSCRQNIVFLKNITDGRGVSLMSAVWWCYIQLEMKTSLELINSTNNDKTADKMSFILGRWSQPQIIIDFDNYFSVTRRCLYLLVQLWGHSKNCTKFIQCSQKPFHSIPLYNYDSM